MFTTCWSQRNLISTLPLKKKNQFLFLSPPIFSATKQNSEKKKKELKISKVPRCRNWSRLDYSPTCSRYSLSCQLQDLRKRHRTKIQQRHPSFHLYLLGTPTRTDSPILELSKTLTVHAMAVNTCILIYRPCKKKTTQQKKNCGARTG